jgi:hypothetical protein
MIDRKSNRRVAPGVPSGPKHPKHQALEDRKVHFRLVSFDELAELASKGERVVFPNHPTMDEPLSAAEVYNMPAKDVLALFASGMNRLRESRVETVEDIVDAQEAGLWLSCPRWLDSRWRRPRSAVGFLKLSAVHLARMIELGLYYSEAGR